MANPLNAAHEYLLTFFYFFYFLFKCPPGWKCTESVEEARRQAVVAACCEKEGHSANCKSASLASPPPPASLSSSSPSALSSHPPTPYHTPSSAVSRPSTWFSWLRAKASSVGRATGRPVVAIGRPIADVGSAIGSGAKWSATQLSRAAKSFFAILVRSPPSQSMVSQPAVTLTATPAGFGSVVSNEKKPPVPPRPVNAPGSDEDVEPPSPTAMKKVVYEEPDCDVIFAVCTTKEDQGQAGSPPTISGLSAAVPQPAAAVSFSEESATEEETAAEKTQQSFSATEAEEDEEEYTPAEFYSTRVFATPPPPPPPPPISQPTYAMKQAVERASSVSRGDREIERRREATPSAEALKNGVAVFPPSMMAEIAGTARKWAGQDDGGVERGVRNPTVRERLREERERSASRPPSVGPVFRPASTVPQAPPVPRRSPSAGPSIYSARAPSTAPFSSPYPSYPARPPSVGPAPFTPQTSSVPRRAFSVGPAPLSRPLSRADDSRDEPHFIFRYPTAPAPESSRAPFQMGRSVYSPLEEAERYRDSYNSSSSNHYGDNYRRSCSRTPASDWRDSRIRSPSLANSRMSTPAPVMFRDEFNEEPLARFRRGNVVETARKWPPPTNAEGAEIGKHAYVDGDGVITTAARRVIEKSSEESWRWRDKDGRLIDEHSERTFMGDRDDLIRDDPMRATHLSQHVFIDTDGSTRFENTHRQYDHNYIVQSTCRNY